MYIKIGLVNVVLLSCLLSVGCANEGELSDSVVQVKNKVASSSCISEFSRNMESYLDGKMSEGEVRSFWQCVDSAVSEFTRVTVGDQNGEYLPANIWRFLHKYFLVDQKVDAGLLVSIMEVKRVLVGGSTALVTKGDLTRLNLLLRELREVCLSLRPHIRILSQREAVSTDRQLKDANEAMDIATTRLANWLEPINQTYKFSDLREFIEGLARNSDSPEDWQNLLKAVSVLAEAKALTVGLPSTEIQPLQWRSLMATVSSGFGILLKWHYSIQADPLESLSRPIVREVLLQAIGILNRGVAARSNAEIPLKEIHGLLALLEDRGWLGKTLTARALSKALRWALVRILSGPENGLGVSESHVRALRNFVGEWEGLSSFAESWPSGISVQPRAIEFAKVLRSAWPILSDNNGRSMFTSFGTLPSYNSRSLQVMTWQFFVVSWLRDSYTTQSEFDAGLMENAVSEVLPIIQQFGYLLSQQITVFKRLMKEGDLFMPGSDGNLLISTTEGTHFLNGLVSSYNSSRVWDVTVGQSCGAPVDTECYRDVVYHQRGIVLAAMPGLQRMLDERNLAGWRDFSKKLELTALGKEMSEPWSTGDRVLYFMLLHYLEAFVQRYDSNQNQTIDLAESLGTFSVFEGNLLRLFSPLGMPSQDILPFFTFLLKYGETYFEHFGGQIEFIRWKTRPNEWQFQSDRPTLLNILFELSKL